MKRTYIILTTTLIVFVIAFLLFIFPGYYFTFGSKKAESTTLPPSSSSHTPPPSSSILGPTTSTSMPTYFPSGSGYPNPSSSQINSGISSSSNSSSANPSSSTSRDVVDSPTQSDGGIIEELGKGILGKLYNKASRESEIKSLSNTIASPVIGITIAATLAAFVLNPLLSLLFNFPFRDILYFFFSSLLEFAGLRKRPRPWGVVYDSINKNPLTRAIVKIIDDSNDKIRETKITDDLGRYGFMAEKGKYRLNVIKQGFNFPSRKTNLDNKGGDGYFDSVYLGGKIIINEGFMGLNIPMDRQSFFPGRSYILFLRLVRLFEKIRLPFLIFGSILSVINLIFFKSILDYAFLIIYLFLWTFEIWQRRKTRPYGLVTDEDGRVLDLAVIRIFEEKNNKLTAVTITNKSGRFAALLPQGNYYLTSSKANYFPSTLKGIKVSKEYIPSLKISMKRSRLEK